MLVFFAMVPSEFLENSQKQASYNLDIMRKLSLNILKLIEAGSRALSLKKEAVCKDLVV